MNNSERAQIERMEKREFRQEHAAMSREYEACRLYSYVLDFTERLKEIVPDFNPEEPDNKVLVDTMRAARIANRNLRNLQYRY